MGNILDMVPGATGKGGVGKGVGEGLSELVGGNINTGLLRFDGGKPRFANKEELKEDPYEPYRSMKRQPQMGGGFDLMALIMGNDPSVMF